MVWEDEVRHADTLRDRRKVYATLLALVAGLGVFRLSWTRSPDEVPAIDVWWLDVLVRVLLSTTLAFFVPAAYFLFTERSIVTASHDPGEGSPRTGSG